MNTRTCPWCGEAFGRRSAGGKPQRFCSTRCRRAMDAGLRAWAQQQFAMGQVSITELQRAHCGEPSSAPLSDDPPTPAFEPASASARIRHHKVEAARAPADYGPNRPCRMEEQ